MPNIVQHPRGFQVSYPLDNTDTTVNQAQSGDVELNTVYQMYLASSIDTDSWVFRTRVLAMAIRFFGNIDEWFDMQAKNSCLYGNNYDFLLETIAFVNGTPRKISILNWIELMYDFPGTLPQGIARRQLSSGVSTEEFISRWCSQPMGFEDMLCTMHVLFGDARPVPVRTNTNCN